MSVTQAAEEPADAPAHEGADLAQRIGEVDAHRGGAAGRAGLVTARARDPGVQPDEAADPLARLGVGLDPGLGARALVGEKLPHALLLGAVERQIGRTERRAVPTVEAQSDRVILGQRAGEGVRIPGAGVGHLGRREQRHVAHRLVELEAGGGRRRLGVGALEERESAEIQRGEGGEVNRHQEAPEAHPGGRQRQTRERPIAGPPGR